MRAISGEHGEIPKEATPLGESKGTQKSKGFIDSTTKKFIKLVSELPVGIGYFKDQMRGIWRHASERCVHVAIQSVGVLATGYLAGAFGKALLDGIGDPTTICLQMAFAGALTALISLRKNYLEEVLKTTLSSKSEKDLLDGVTKQRLSRVQHPDFQSEIITVSQNLHRVSNFVESNLGLVNKTIQVGFALIALAYIHPYLAVGLVVASLPRVCVSLIQIKDRETVDESNKEDLKHYYFGRWAMLTPSFLREVLLFGRASRHAADIGTKFEKTQQRQIELSNRSARRDLFADSISQVGLGFGIFSLIHLFQIGAIDYSLAGLALGAMSGLGQQLSDFGKLVASYGENLAMVSRYRSVTAPQQEQTRTSEEEECVKSAVEVAHKYGVSP